MSRLWWWLLAAVTGYEDDASCVRNGGRCIGDVAGLYDSGSARTTSCVVLLRMATLIIVDINSSPPLILYILT